MIKAIRFEKTGGSDVLQYVDYDLPPPAKGQVQVKHSAICVNFIDTYHRTGLYALPLPSGLGSEAAGTVAALGEGVTGFQIGDRVGYSSGAIGSYAEANNVPATKLVKLPDAISDETAAAILLLRDQGRLSLDDTVSHYVPGITGGDRITIRQPPSHTAGLQDYWPQD